MPGPALGLILLFLSSLTWQCQSVKKNGSDACTERGTVQDFTGLDGCALLIVTEQGEKLLPGAIDDPGFELQAGQQIRFSYREMPDQMSICMAEDKIVRITCIRLDTNRPAIPRCDKVDKIEPKTWLAKLQTTHQPEQIIRYPYKTNGWAYLFTGKAFYLYDCQGALIRKGDSAEACLEGEVTERDAGVVIE